MKKALLLIILISSIIVKSQLANWAPVLSGTNFPTNLVGQINGMTRITQMKFHNTSSTKFYAVTSQGGLFLTNNAGTSWTVAPGTETMTVNSSAVCVDNANDQNIWLGTGDPNYYSNGSGIYFSNNGGVSFTATALNNCLVIEILQNPTNGAELVAATNKGIYKSTNSGSTWSAVTATTLAFCDLKSNAAVNSQTLYACTNEVNSKFLRSTDFGNTWSQITSGIATPTAQTQSGARIGVTPSSTNVVYFELISDGGMVHKSNDGGLNFLLKKTGGTPYLTFYSNTVTAGGQGNYNNAITVDRNNPANVWLQAHNTWFSADSGATWSMLTFWAFDVHTDMHQITQSPYNSNQLYSCNDGGVWLSTNGGYSWTPKSDGIYAFEIGNETGVSSLTKPNFVSIGTQDNARLYGNGTAWYTISGGDDYAKRQFDYNGHIYIDGTNRQLNHTGASATYNLPTTNWNCFGFNRTNNNLAFMGQVNIYRSTDVGNASPTWTPISSTGYTISAIHSCIANANRLYALTSTGSVVVCSNALSSSPTYSYVNPGGGNTSIGSIVAMANNADVVYVHKNNAIYRSTDGGVTWTNVTYNLPSVNHRRILAEEYGGTTQLVFVATNNAVYYLKSGQTSWTIYNSGLPTRKSPTGFSMYDDGTNRAKIRYASYGRAMWESGFSNLRAFNANILFESDSVITCSTPSVILKDGTVGGNNTPLTYTWTLAGASPSVAYTSSVAAIYSVTGTYTLSLTVKDANNAVSTKTLAKFIQVIPCATDTVPGNLLQVNGTTNYATINSSLNIGVTNSITLSAWIKIDATQPSYAGIIFSNVGGATGLDFRSNNQLGYHYNNAASSYNYAGGPTVPTGIWVHVALVTTANSAILYMNGVPYVNNVANPALNFNGTFNLGNDRNNSSRTMTGQIDEVCIYKRALSQNEVRELMHLTRNHNVVDPDLVAYYQFNEVGSTIYDRAGNVNASLIGSATHTISTAPVGSGNSERQTINTTGVKTFTAEGMNMSFPGTSLPNGEVCVTRLNIRPDSLPNNNPPFTSARYWVANNYGNNNFNAITTLTLTGYGTISTFEANAPRKFRLYTRATGGYLNGSWVLTDSAYAATSGTNAVLSFSGNAVNSFNKQFYITKSPCVSASAGSLAVSALTVCPGQSVSLSLLTGTLNDATSWAWSAGSCTGSAAGSGTAIVVNPTVTTTYYVTGAGGCVVPNSGSCTAITVSVNTTVQTPTVPGPINAPTVACQGATQLYSVAPVAGATSYTWTFPGGWSGSSTSNTILITTPSGVGQVAVKAGNVCGTSPSRTIQVSVSPTIAASQQLTLCAGDQLVVGTQTYNATGTYTTLLKRSSGCDSLVTTNLTIDATINTAVIANDTELVAQATNGNFQWIDCDTKTPINGANSASFTATQNGNYAVVVTVNNCSDTSACQNMVSVGIASKGNLNQSKVYPNPATNVLTIETNVHKQYAIYNALGQLVQQGELKSTLQKIDISKLAAGAYTVALGKEGKEVFRVIVE